MIASFSLREADALPQSLSVPSTSLLQLEAASSQLHVSIDSLLGALDINVVL